MAKRWYVLHVFSGSEKKVAQAILEQAAANGLKDQIEDVMVPTENVVEVKRGVRVEGERKFFPGYIIVKLELTDEAWQLVTSQPRVTGFLGGKGNPVPITKSEAERLIRQMSEGVERLLKLSLVEKGLCLTEQVPLELLQLVTIHILADLRSRPSIREGGGNGRGRR